MKKNKTILIAEDEKQIIHFIVNAFEKLNFNVIKSYDGVDTVNKATKFVPDIILLDILMPKKNGIDVIKELRAEGSSCLKIPIIVLSALDKIYQKREALDAGANEYLCKPMFTEDIVNEVFKWVD